jgi:hypothetical protein
MKDIMKDGLTQDAQALPEPFEPGITEITLPLGGINMRQNYILLNE